MNVQTLAQQLIRIPSVTPDGGAALDWVEANLKPLNPKSHRLSFSASDTPTVDNLFTTVGTGNGPHICFVGHVDVVPVGTLANWKHPPFDAVIEDGILYGRGASDMKGSIAAFLTALHATAEQVLPLGRVSMLLTADEEGPAINGVQKVLPWLVENRLMPDFCLVGEPTSLERVGDTLKIGRRGSLTLELTLNGVAGHVAYPHLACNPIPALGEIMNTLSQTALDSGTEWFDASTLEIAWVDCANRATNVIPDKASCVFNIRHNPLHNESSLQAWCKKIIERTLHGKKQLNYTLTVLGSSQAFLCQNETLIAHLQHAVTSVTGQPAQLSTSGGTSDARFIHNYCPVIECGPLNATIHKVNEMIRVTDLEILTQMYQSFILSSFTHHRSKATA